MITTGANQVKWAEGEIANFSCSPGYVMFGPRTRFSLEKTLPKPKRALQLSAFANVLLLLGNGGGRKCVAGEGIE